MSLNEPPTGSSGPKQNRCKRCHSYISHRFARVFGNNEDEVHGCIDCSTLHSLRDGEGSEPRGQADGPNVDF